MKFPQQIQEGIFLKRYKRFFADIDWNGEKIVAHVPNTGSMKGCNTPGSLCRFTVSDDPSRKLKYTLEMIRAESGAWVGVNTATPNKIVREALLAGLLPHWKNAGEVRPEYKISKQTRFDFALIREGHEKMHFVEVKNVSMVDGKQARFPDAVTERGQKHLRELMLLVEQGHTAELVFTVHRGDAESFAPADDIDPEYGRLLRDAIKAGVRVTPLVVEMSDVHVSLSSKILPIEV